MRQPAPPSNSPQLRRRGLGARLQPIVLLLALAAMLAACGPPPTPLRVATIPWVGYQPLFLAQDLEFIESDAVRLVEFSSNTESLRAFRNRNVEAAALTLDEALLLASEGHAMAVILVMDYSAGADALVARAPVSELSALKGLRIGVESTANGAYVLARALQLAGLQAGDVQIVKLQSSDQVEAYRAGKIDAVVTYEPLRTQLAQLGASTIFDSRQIPGEIVDVLAIHTEALDRHSGHVGSLLRGWFAAVEFQAHSPGEAARRLAPRLGMQPEEYLAAIGGVQFGTLEENCRALSASPDESGLIAAAQRLAVVMYANGLLSAFPHSSRLPDPGPIEALGCRGRTGSG